MDSNTETYTKTFSIDLERAKYHLTCKRRRRKRLLIVVGIWLLILLYFLLPISKVNLKVEGNVYYTKEDLMSMTRIEETDYWWLVNTKDAQKVLNSYDYIDGARFKKSFFGVKLKINEVYPIAIKDDKYVMSNKQIVEKTAYDFSDRVGDLLAFDNVDANDLDYLVSKYVHINLNIRKDFKDISIIRDSNSYRYVKLFGYNERIGYFVIKTDLVYLSTKFNGNKYNQIMEEVSKNNVKYEKENPALIAYHYLDEEEFRLVENFEEE